MKPKIYGDLKKTKKLWIIISLSFFNFMFSQEDTTQSYYKDPVTKTWINTYGNFRITDKFFWIAQTHFRFQETEDTPYVGQIAQLYNRHALGYILSKKTNVSLGGVLRLNFNTDETSIEKNLVPEWRIWHQYMFATPLDPIMFYHRIRIEHRWTKGFSEDSEYSFRNRWRYMFKAKVPLNSTKLKEKTFYFSPEAELIMQSGKSVVGSPMEDLRLHASVGYIVTPKLTFATGIMYSMGQDLNDSYVFKQNWTARFHVYFSPDLRKEKNKLPAIHMND